MHVLREMLKQQPQAQTARLTKAEKLKARKAELREERKQRQRMRHHTRVVMTKGGQYIRYENRPRRPDEIVEDGDDVIEWVEPAQPTPAERALTRERAVIEGSPQLRSIFTLLPGDAPTFCIFASMVLDDRLIESIPLYDAYTSRWPLPDITPVAHFSPLHDPPHTCTSISTSRRVQYLILWEFRYMLRRRAAAAQLKPRACTKPAVVDMPPLVRKRWLRKQVRREREAAEYRPTSLAAATTHVTRSAPLAITLLNDSARSMVDGADADGMRTRANTDRRTSNAPISKGEDIECRKAVTGAGDLDESTEEEVPPSLVKNGSQKGGSDEPVPTVASVIRDAWGRVVAWVVRVVETVRCVAASVSLAAGRWAVGLYKKLW